MPRHLPHRAPSAAGLRCRYSGENKGGVGTVVGAGVGVGKDGKQGPGEYSVMYDAQGNPLEYM